ncbi:hypothetical protein Efla_001789 [Eimeria flavescens]
MRRLWREAAAAPAAAAVAAAAAAAAAVNLPLLASGHTPFAEQQQQQQGLPVWASKLLATGILMLVSAGGAALPVYLQRKAAAEETLHQGEETRSLQTRQRQSWVQVLLVFLNCFACGAFLGLGLLHLLPEAAAQLEEAGVSVHLSDGDHSHSYNSAYALAAAGLTFMLFMDQLWGQHAHSHGHSHGDTDSDEDSVAAAAESATAAAAAAAAAALPHTSHLHAQQHGSCSEAAYCPECDDCVEEANTAANEQDLGCSQRSPAGPAAAAAAAGNDAAGQQQQQQQQDRAAASRAARCVLAAAAAGKGSVVVPVEAASREGRRGSSGSNGSNKRLSPCSPSSCAGGAAAGSAAAAAAGGDACHGATCCSRADACAGSGPHGCCSRSHSPDSELRVHCGLTGDKCQVVRHPCCCCSQGYSDEAYLLQKLQQQQQQTAGAQGGSAGGKGGSRVPLAIALGTHALLEAMVVGTTRSGPDVWLSTLAILGHKGAEAVALASALLKAGGSVCCNLVCFAAFVAATPVGVLVGSFVAQGGQAAAGVLNALAVGIILYACIEMLSEFSVKAPLSRRLLRCFAFLCGLGLLFGLDLLHAPVCQEHRHRPTSCCSSHQHGHSHDSAACAAAAAPAAAVAAAGPPHSHHHAAEGLAHHHHHDDHHHEHQQQQQQPLSSAAAAAAGQEGSSTLRGTFSRGSERR